MTWHCHCPLEHACCSAVACNGIAMDDQLDDLLRGSATAVLSHAMDDELDDLLRGSATAESSVPTAEVSVVEADDSAGAQCKCTISLTN